MNDCDEDEAALLAKIGCILTYNGSIYHSSINYSLLSVSLLAAARYPTTSRFRAVTALIFASSFQIGLCLFVDCSGISIIWCSIAGWLWTGHCCDRRGSGSNAAAPPTAVRVALWADGIGILHYFFTLPFITTIAHGCALGMGAMLHYFMATNPSSRNSSDVMPLYSTFDNEIEVQSSSD